MSTLGVRFEPLAIDVKVTAHALQVVLADGREVRAPLAWFPRISNASQEERNNWRLIGGGIGIHWPDVNEDISVESLIAVR